MYFQQSTVKFICSYSSPDLYIPFTKSEDSVM